MAKVCLTYAVIVFSVDGLGEFGYGYYIIT